ncbi:hypothetical protein Tco_0557037 [Tanacetum coccineum]
MLVGAFVHRTTSRDKVQKPDLWLLSLLDEGYNSNVAWILAEYLSWRAPGIKEESKIYGGHFVTKIAKKKTKKLSPITPLEAPPQARNLLRSEPSGLDSGIVPSYGGNSIVPSPGYEIEGSSRGVQDDDDDDVEISLETASQAIHDAVTTHQVTVSHHFMTASARTDSNADLEDSSYNGDNL